MARPDINTEEGQKILAARLDADFSGLAQTKGIPLKRQAELAQLSILAISAVADDRPGLRTFCKDVLHLDPATDAAHLVEVAALLDLWESCKTRAEAQHKADAEAVLSKLPRAANKSELQDIKSRFEALHYALDDKATAASATLELHFDQVEQGELRPTTLSQYVSREHVEAEHYGAVIDKSTGAIKIKKNFIEGKKPSSPEEFRASIKLVAHTWVMCFLRYPQKPFLKDASISQWLRYADYILGEHVHQLTAKDSQGHDMSTPPWELVLAYDYQIRRGMVRLINEGLSIATALDHAMKDAVIKERYFVTPCALTSVMSVPHRSRSPFNRGTRTDGSFGDQARTFKGKGNQKGKSKKGKNKGLVYHSKTPDGRELCYAWNNANSRCRFNCGRVHACQICFGSHPAHACPKHKDTAGSAAPADSKESTS